MCVSRLRSGMEGVGERIKDNFSGTMKEIGLFGLKVILCSMDVHETSSAFPLVHVQTENKGNQCLSIKDLTSCVANMANILDCRSAKAEPP